MRKSSKWKINSPISQQSNLHADPKAPGTRNNSPKMSLFGLKTFPVLPLGKTLIRPLFAEHFAHRSTRNSENFRFFPVISRKTGNFSAQTGSRVLLPPPPSRRNRDFPAGSGKSPLCCVFCVRLDPQRLCSG